MEVVIAGGHGRVALRLTRQLTRRGDRVRSLIRDPAHAADVREAGGDPVIADLESAGDELALVTARKETVDHGAAVKMMRAAKASGIRRYVIVSSIGADAGADGEEMGPYRRAKGRADDALRESGLDFTIVRPGRLTDEPGTGLVALGASVGPGQIPRDDVAAVIAAALHQPATIGRTFEVVGGDVPIEAALAST